MIKTYEYTIMQFRQLMSSKFCPNLKSQACFSVVRVNGILLCTCSKWSDKQTQYLKGLTQTVCQSHTPLSYATRVLEVVSDWRGPITSRRGSLGKYAFEVLVGCLFWVYINYVSVHYPSLRLWEAR